EARSDAPSDTGTAVRSLAVGGTVAVDSAWPGLGAARAPRAPPGHQQSPRAGQKYARPPDSPGHPDPAAARDGDPRHFAVGSNNGTRRNADWTDLRGSREEKPSGLIRENPPNPCSSASYFCWATDYEGDISCSAPTGLL